jgi:dTDP-4-dehydrorhamnose reductase
MKILLLGANGQVGTELSRALSPLGDVVRATRSGGAGFLRADLGDKDSLRVALDEANADVVVNAAAYTAVDRAESDVDAAQRINGEALGDIGAWAKRRGALVVHYSTDYVFDGEGARPYREDDATSPLGVYGHSKLAGEAALRDSGCDYLLFRTAWVYAAHGKNFLLTMLKVGAQRDELRVVDDQRGTPTTARLIAETTASVLRALDPKNRNASLGTYHLCASGQCTWFDFAQSIFERATKMGLMERAPRMVAITTADYPTPARRPHYSVLDTTKLRETFALMLPNWQDDLDTTLRELQTPA